jgi:hypothetical protein
MSEEKTTKMYDVEVGTGSHILGVGRYKKDNATHYKFGIHLNIPDFTPEAIEKLDLINVGARYILGNRAAAIFRSSSDYGTKEDAEAFSAQYSSLEGWLIEREKATRVSTVTPLIDCARDMLKIVLAKLRFKKALNDLDKDERKAVYEEVKESQKTNNGNWQKILAAAPAELEKRAKAAEKTLDGFV